MVNKNKNKHDNKDSFTAKDINDISKLSNVFQGLINKVKSVALNNSNTNENEIALMQHQLDDALEYETNLISRYTSDKEMTTMLNKILRIQDTTNPALINKSIQDILEDDMGQYGVFFYDRYKNVNNQYEDLRVITEYLYEMEEVVNTVRDNLVCADDLGVTISRQLTFNGENINSKSLIEEVERVEKKYNLKNMLKNVVYKHTLTYGNYYVYTIPYSKLFAMYKSRERKAFNSGRTFESYDDIALEGSVVKASDFFNSTDDKNIIQSITESYNNQIASVPGEKKLKFDEVSKNIQSLLENIEIVDSDEIPLLEDSDISAFRDPKFLELVNKAQKSIKKDSNNNSINPTTNPEQNVNFTSDGIIDPQDMREFKDVTGTYIRFYSPTKVIPINILDYNIGYYILYETYGEVQNNTLVNGSMNRLNLVFPENRRREMDNSIINLVAEKIVKSINKKFIQENAKFKELVANAIAHDNFYRKAFRVQFVPTEYMTAFKINEDPERRMGESILKKSLFYAKLYLSLLIFKIITILTKSNDQRVYYIKNSGINKNMIAKVQETARAMKRNQINFNDMACVNTILSKVGKNPDIYMPVGKSGERSVEFDILSGQDVQINTDFMEFLRKNMINNTGVPSIVLSFMEEADFARTITMQNSKYLSRIISYQEECEVATTELYRKILSYESSLNENEIECFEYKLTRPKALNIQNMNDLINNAETTAGFIVKTLVGEDADEGLRNKVTSLIIRKVLMNGVYDWDKLDLYVKEAMLQIKEEGIAKNLISSEDSGEG